MNIPKDFVARFYLEEGVEAPNVKMRQILIGDFVRKFGMLVDDIEPIFSNWENEYESINGFPGNLRNPDYRKFIHEKMEPHIEAINALPGRINLAVEVGEDYDDFYGIVKNNDKIRIRICEKEE